MRRMRDTVDEGKWDLCAHDDVGCGDVTRCEYAF